MILERKTNGQIFKIILKIIIAFYFMSKLYNSFIEYKAVYF